MGHKELRKERKGGHSIKIQYFTRAMEDAQGRKHEYLTLEHVLLALLHDPETTQLIQGCGGKTRKLEEDLNLYLDNKVEKLPEGIGQESLVECSWPEGSVRRDSLAFQHVEGVQGECG